MGMRRSDECETIVQTCGDREIEIKQLNEQLETLMLNLAKLRDEKAQMVAKGNQITNEANSMKYQLEM